MRGVFARARCPSRALRDGPGPDEQGPATDTVRDSDGGGWPSRCAARSRDGMETVTRHGWTLLLTVSLLIPGAVEAQERSAFRLGPSLGVNFFPNSVDVVQARQVVIPEADVDNIISADYRPAVVEGIEFGYRLSDRWGAEVDFVHSIPDVELEAESSRVAIDEDRTIHLAGNANYYFPSSGRLTPFVSGGLGAVLRQEDQSDQDFMVNVGAGATYRLASRVDLRGTLRDYISSFDRFEGREGIDATLVNEIYLTLGVDVHP